LDGATPTTQSNKYTSPIEISKATMNQGTIIANNQTSPNHDGFSFTPEQVNKAITVTAVSSYQPSNLNRRKYSKEVNNTYILDQSLFDSKLPVISLTMDPKQLYDFDDGIFVPGKWYENDSAWSGN